MGKDWQYFFVFKTSWKHKDCTLHALFFRCLGQNLLLCMCALKSVVILRIPSALRNLWSDLCSLILPAVMSRQEGVDLTHYVSSLEQEFLFPCCCSRMRMNLFLLYFPSWLWKSFHFLVIWELQWIASKIAELCDGKVPLCLISVELSALW